MIILRRLEVIFPRIQAYLGSFSFSAGFLDFIFASDVPSTTFILMFLTVVISTIFSKHFGRTRVKPAPTSHPLTCLLHVLTPACSLWPQMYMTLPKAHHCLRIPLKILIEDIITGKIELRAPEDDLRQLLAGNGCLNIGEYALVFAVGWQLRLEILWWWMKAMLYTGQCITYLKFDECSKPELVGKSSRNQSSDLSKYSESNVSLGLYMIGSTKRPVGSRSQKDNMMRPMTGPQSILPSLIPKLPTHILHKLSVAATLDSIPLAKLESVLLASNPGSVTLLEFTGCDPHVTPGSTAWALVAIPLARARCTSRTATLPGVLAALESSCTVLSVKNVSDQYAQFLGDYARDLDNPSGRGRFLAEWGGEDAVGALRAWRAEKLWAQWRMACYLTGGLVRWVVCMKRLQ